MTPLEIFEGSNGEATKALYEKLAQLGPIGHVALNLFRACKCSGRAKVYRGRSSKEWRSNAYDRKNWSLQQLTDALQKEGDAIALQWGWKIDPAQEFHKWVLYVELPTGQVSFHAATRTCEREYAGEWDQTTNSPSRIIAFVDQLLANESAFPDNT